MGGRKRGKEGEEGCEGRLRDDDRVCPLRHKKTELCDVCQNRSVYYYYVDSGHVSSC